MTDLKTAITDGTIDLETQRFYRTDVSIIERFVQVNKSFTDAVQKWALSKGFTTQETNGVLYSDEIGPMAFISPSPTLLDAGIFSPVEAGSKVHVFATDAEGVISGEAMPYITDLMQVVGKMTTGVRVWNLAAFVSAELTFKDSTDLPIAVVGIPKPNATDDTNLVDSADGIALMVPVSLMPDEGFASELVNTYGISRLTPEQFIKVLEDADKFYKPADSTDGAEAVVSDSVDIQVRKAK